MSQDTSQGYNAVAAQFITARSDSGTSVIRDWARRLPKGASVLDCGCGHGIPITQTLIECGLNVSAIDASPNMVAALRKQFPTVPVACEPAESSRFFGETFDGIVAIGLIFLMAEPSQRKLLARLEAALNPQGRLLFSAPYQTGSWEDILTGQKSVSLGLHGYTNILENTGLQLIATHEDEGQTHYFEATKH